MSYNKVFISTPMTGLSEKEVRENITRASLYLKKKFGLHDNQIVHNYDCKLPDGAKPLEYLAEAIKQLADCDACLFTPKYWDSPGCIAERRICWEYDIKILDEYDELTL